ncbi:imidazole glycerol phosphate synthase subunit HisH [Ruminococcaceae bacterium OttesenSCG-928-A16]|nr:imidazole glycerol phosphate synthase subunit HisH [Ruminococcaceae bacterium OttesenSCG-928-A16]
MIAIVDYGVGNLFSLRSSLSALGLVAEVTGDPKQLAAASHIILPGVGAFANAMAKLQGAGLAGVVRQQAAAGKPLLGICLGMQLLFQKSYEFGEHEGLGLVPGQVCPLAPDLAMAGYNYKVPHIGWNPLQIQRPQSPILRYTQEGDSVYYVHSFYAKNCDEAVVATSEYGVTVTGAVQKGNVFGTQFHPEKSGDVGLAMLKAFAEVETC